MTYRNLESIIKALPVEEWIKTDIEMSVDVFLKETLECWLELLKLWLELLSTDGCNSKSMVINDIQYLLED